MSIKAARKKVARDEFPMGTVVRWTSSGKYTYVALKTEVGWFTTAQHFNTYVPGKCDFTELLEILSRSESSDVEIVSTWEPIPDGK